jgi:protein-S-isoprenylcysteine O-methyltransferase Ste14
MIFLLSSHNKLVAFFGLCRAILPLLTLPTQVSVCPSGYSSVLLSLSAESAVLVVSLLGGGILRFPAFHQLQQSFTFAIAKPTELVRSGLYAYMQHPSYTGAILLVIGFCALVLRTGGVMTCCSTNPVLGLVGRSLGYVSNIYYTLLVILVIPRRIWQEEELLRKAFGEEWVEYHRSTARLIPCVF